MRLSVGHAGIVRSLQERTQLRGGAAGAGIFADTEAEGKALSVRGGDQLWKLGLSVKSMCYDRSQ
jgi:hypothetical protein